MIGQTFFSKLPSISEPPERARTGALGRAEVVSLVTGDAVVVRDLATGQEREAELAVIGYRPAIGDRVLVARADGSAVVIGAFGAARLRSEEHRCLSETGLRIEKEADGSVTLSAPSGPLHVTAKGDISLRTGADLTMCATRSLSVEAPEALVRAGRLETHASRIVEISGAVYRHAEGLVEIQAKSLRALVSGACSWVASRTSISSEEDTVVDGKRVLLG